jgi:hypothetical protein
MIGGTEWRTPFGGPSLRNLGSASLVLNFRILGFSCAKTQKCELGIQVFRKYQTGGEY